MAVPLSEELRAALDANAGGPVEVVDERTNEEYVLVRADRYDLLQAFTASDVEADSEAWLAAGVDALRRVEWDAELPWGGSDEPG